MENKSPRGGSGQAAHGAAYRDLENRLLRSDCQYAPHDWFRWMLEDVLADLTGGRKPNPPPEAVIGELRELGRLYAQCVIEAPPFTDVLGSLYLSLASHGAKKQLGQYFTPPSVAEIVAQLKGLPTKPNPNGGLWSILEPAVGSGAMLLAPARILHRVDPDALQWWSFRGIDKDRFCSLMCAIQLAANAFVHQCAIGEIAVYCGNALVPMTAENLDVVIHAVADPERASVRPKETAVPDAPAPATGIDATDESASLSYAEGQPPAETGQLDLFFD